MYLVSLRAARCLRSGHHYQLTTIILKCFPLDEQKCPVTAYGRVGFQFAKPNHIFDQGVGDKINQSFGLAVHCMQFGAYISYCVDIITVGSDSQQTAGNM